jgi:hypothetical protein
VVGSSGGSAWRVSVAPDEVPDAINCLATLGLAVEPREGGVLSVSGSVTDGSQLSCVLAAEGIYVSGLTQEKPDLERVFLSLTDGGSS